jgi:mono/diheme cytochrome c family protein
MKISNLKAISLGVLGFAVLAVGVSSCKNDPLSPGVEYMPDMYRSPSVETYSTNSFFKDSLANRKPVPGTVTIGDRWNNEFSPNAIPYPYENTPEGYEKAGAELKNPLPKTAENIEQGKQIYTKFCVHCHGTTGQGDGTIVANGKFPGPPPSYSGPLANLSEGKMFHTITYGKGLMGSHASQLNKVERWKVAMYVQTLQHPNGEASAAAGDSTAVAGNDTTGAATAGKMKDNK